MADDAGEAPEEAPEEAPPEVEEEVVKETSYTSGGGGSAGHGPSVGSAGEGSLVSNIPLTDDEILEQLKNLDAEARERATKIQLMRDSIMRYQEVEHMTDEIAEKLEQKQRALIEELQEFDRITVEIQRLIGIAEASGISIGPSAEGVPEGERPSMRLGPAAKEIGYMASGIPGNIPEYLTDRTPKLITVKYREGIPQVIMVDSPRKGGACQPLSVEGLDALARQNAKMNAEQREANRRCALASVCQPICPPPNNIRCFFEGNLQCLQGEIDQLKDENCKLNGLIVQLVHDSLQPKCPPPPCPGSCAPQPCPGSCAPQPCNVPPCVSPPPCRPPPGRTICAPPPCPPAPCPPAPCVSPPCCKSHPPPPCRLPPCPPEPCAPLPPCSPEPCCQPCPPQPCYQPCPPPLCSPPPCQPAPCPSGPCSSPSKSLCPNYLAQQMDKLEQELQELQQMLACERMEVELDKLKQLKASCKAMPCSLIPRCPPKPCPAKPCK